jgi:hypothetical protein
LLGLLLELAVTDRFGSEPPNAAAGIDQIMIKASAVRDRELAICA